MTFLFRIEDRINLDHMQSLKVHFDKADNGRLSMKMFILVMSQLLNLPDEVRGPLTQVQRAEPSAL